MSRKAASIASAFPPGGDADFARDGVVGPVPLLRAEECRALARHLDSPARRAPVVWSKGLAASDWVFAHIGTDPRLTRLLVPLLGEDIVLWGCSIARRAPGDIHPWHVDIESSDSPGFVTVWIGIENTSGASGLALLAGSHLGGKSVQQVRTERGIGKPEFSPEALEWARELNPDARLLAPQVSDGDAILFDGRIWHGSENRDPTRTRKALLLQFAAADVPVRIPDFNVGRWPFKILDNPRPPCVTVHGTPRSAANALVPPPQPPDANLPALSSVVCNDLRPPPADPERSWSPSPMFRGATPQLALMSCHSAVLSPGHSPHPPHAHGDEELLMVLDGEADLLVADRPEYEGARAVRVKAGDFAYYPPLQHHTIRNASDAPVHYLMFRWRGHAAATGANILGPSIFQAPPEAAAGTGRPFNTRLVLDAPTRWLAKLHCHTSRLEPGRGYAAHVDAYDVAIFVQSGVVETLGRQAGAGSLIYYPAGELHGMHNPGDQPARYITFEFHGRRAAPIQRAGTGLAAE